MEPRCRAPLTGELSFGALLGDKALDIDWIRQDLAARGATAVIPPRAYRTQVINCDKALYE